MMCFLLESVIMLNTLRGSVAIAAPTLSNARNRSQVIVTFFKDDLFCVVGLVGDIVAKIAELPCHWNHFLIL